MGLGLGGEGVWTGARPENGPDNRPASDYHITTMRRDEVRRMKDEKGRSGVLLLS
jgi:hypothetical protein